MKRTVLIMIVLCLAFSVPCYGRENQSMVLIEASTGRILSSNNENARLPMASLTKIMTALVVIKSVESLEEKVVIDDRSAGTEGSSMYLKIGDTVTVKDLLYGLMLVSGNDAAMALAYHVGKNIDGFSKLMNDTARDLGLQNTCFLNPSGLYEEGHYTSAADFARLTAHALQNPTFAEIVKTRKYMFGKQALINHNRLLFEVEGCIGVKTGYTKACGRCLVSAVERDGVVLICVTLNCSNNWNVHKQLYDKNFGRCKRIKLLDEKEIYNSIAVVGGHNAGYYCLDGYGVIIDENITYDVRVHAPPFLYSNKKVGDEIGYVEVRQDNVVLTRTPLIIDRDTRRVKKSTSFFFKLFEFVLHIFKF